MKEQRKFFVEVFNSKDCDTDYRKSKEFATYKAAQRCAIKLSAKQDEDEYVFVHIPMKDGNYEYRLREEYEFGKLVPFSRMEVW